MQQYLKDNYPMLIFTAILLGLIIWTASITPANQNVGSPQYCDTEGC